MTMPTLKLRWSATPVSLPAGWVDRSQLIVAGPLEDGFCSNCVVVCEEVKPGTTVEAFAAAQLAGLKHLPGCRTGREAPATFGGVSGILRELEQRSAQLHVAQLQFYLVDGASAATVTYTTRAKRMKAERESAERIIGELARASVSAPPQVPLDRDASGFQR
jgi:hypothetical protein